MTTPENILSRILSRLPEAIRARAEKEAEESAAAAELAAATLGLLPHERAQAAGRARAAVLARYTAAADEADRVAEDAAGKASDGYLSALCAPATDLELETSATFAYAAALRARAAFWAPTDRVTAEELAEVARLEETRLAPEGVWRLTDEHAATKRLEDLGPHLLPKLAAEVTALRASLRTIDVELDHAGAPFGPEDGSGVYTADGRVIALGLALSALRAERETLRAERDAAQVARSGGSRI